MGQLADMFVAVFESGIVRSRVAAALYMDVETEE